MRLHILIIIMFIIIISIGSASAQINRQGFSGGVGFGATFPITESGDQSHAFARGFLRTSLLSRLQGELGVGLAQLRGPQYKTDVVPIEARLLFSPLSFENWNPYLYGGFGAASYRVTTVPTNAHRSAKLEQWAVVVPAGMGLQLTLDETKVFEVSGGYSYSFSDDLNAIRTNSSKDGFWSVNAGITITGIDLFGDLDHDGLINKSESQLGTDLRSSDTDLDGLPDGEEVLTTMTSPLKKDTDSDGLSDYEEIRTYATNPTVADADADGLTDREEIVTHRTDPLKKDSDADGLTDGDEIRKFQTDALAADSDRDQLTDGQEINTHRTLPGKADTDEDGLADGIELLTQKTDPLKKDTDGGGLDDNVEVSRNMNPLMAQDDVPRQKEEKKVVTFEIDNGKDVVLEGIVFETGSARVTRESERILDEVVSELRTNTGLTVEVQGHTDNTGSRSTNMKLSQQRADAVKDYLMKKGIAGERLVAKGYGPDRPITANTSAEERKRNRRIAFSKVDR